jgi:hypothetical protein
MLSAKEGKFMETKKATIKRGDSSTYLVLETNEKKLEIVLTDDNPNNIMSAFNNLLKDLKLGLFQYNLDDSKEDLYFHICKEYIKQLNSELKAVYIELKDFDLIEKKI